MGSFFIQTPEFALVPALVFLIAWYMGDEVVSPMAALLWSCYAVFETLNKYKVTPLVEHASRMELRLIYPALVLFSVAAFVAVIIGAAVDSDRR